MSIQLVLQISGGGRLDIPGMWSPQSTLEQVISSIQSMLPPVEETSNLRYLQTTVPKTKWSSTTLKQLGLQEGRALLILEESKEAAPAAANNPIESALDFLLQSNFDADSKPCVLTLIKILDNVLQNPGVSKVRSIKLSNGAFHNKVGQRKGGIEFLISCGFVRSMSEPQLLSNGQGEEVLILEPQNEDTSLLVRARHLLAQRGARDLHMEQLPKYKSPPPAAASSSSISTSSAAFDPYKGHRYDAKSAAAGVSLGPDRPYVSPTETQLKSLQEQKKRLEQQQQQQLQDREIVAGLPSTNNQPLSSVETQPAKGDGSLLAAQFQKREQERKQREEGGFTTKAMRNLEKLKNQKVYSHASLRIQFADGSYVQAKFLPKETIGMVHAVVRESLIRENMEFDLYVAPPRRKLDPKSTLQQEGLVPAAKVFCSWKVGSAPAKGTPVGSFIRPNLFESKESGQQYPTSQPIVAPKSKAEDKSSSKPSEASAPDNNKNDREEEMMRRMMGGGKKKSSTTKKPKWFKK